jgi:hypothetical protein
MTPDQIQVLRRLRDEARSDVEWYMRRVLDAVGEDTTDLVVEMKEERRRLSALNAAVAAIPMPELPAVSPPLAWSVTGARATLQKGPHLLLDLVWYDGLFHHYELRGAPIPAERLADMISREVTP